MPPAPYAVRKPLRKVLLTADTVGGVWTFATELAAGLSKEDVEVHLATLGGPLSLGQQREAAQIPNLQLLESDFKLEWMENPWEDVEASGRWLLDLEKQIAPDVVHLNSYGHGGLPWRAPVILTAHSCVATWWEAVKRAPLPPSWSRYRNAVERSLSSAAVVSVPSRALLESLRRSYDAPLFSPRAVVIPNGRSTAHVTTGPKEDIVLTAGRLWDDAKNPRALRSIAADLPWPVLFAGHTQSAFDRWETAPNCTYLGRLDPLELQSYYARASIYALPARYEPFGLSVLEAANSGCALVLGDIESLRENWQDAAMFVCPGDHEELARILRHLIEDPAARAQLAARSMQRAREFTVERMVAGYMNLYRSAKERGYACAS